MRLRTAAVFVVAVGLALSSTPASGADPVWTQVATGITGGISGIAPEPSGWLIVRDNKVEGQNRVARLSASGAVTPLSWPGADPQDLESLAAVPGSPGYFAALESSGRGTMFSLGASEVQIESRFVVPRGTSNVESFALTRIGTSTVAVWATRGSATNPSKVFAATFVPASGAFGRVMVGSVSVPYPTNHVRHISDLTIVEGRLLGSATSDPGNRGPFVSAMYDFGSVSMTSTRAVLNLPGPAPLGIQASHKIEAVTCLGTSGLLGSDDELQGGWTSAATFCGP